MIDTGIIEVLRRKFTRLASELNERGRRRWAASEALELGHGGIKVVAQATGLGGRAVRRGGEEMCHGPEAGGSHVRAPSPGAWGRVGFAVGVKNCVTSRHQRVRPAGGFGTWEAGANRCRPMILPWSLRWKRWGTRTR